TFDKPVMLLGGSAAVPAAGRPHFGKHLLRRLDLARQITNAFPQCRFDLVAYCVGARLRVDLRNKTRTVDLDRPSTVLFHSAWIAASVAVPAKSLCRARPSLSSVRK